MDSCFMTLYGEWQKFLRERPPKTLIFWGQNDVFFSREGEELICATCRTRKCTGWIPGTSRLRIRWM